MYDWLYDINPAPHISCFKIMDNLLLAVFITCLRSLLAKTAPPISVLTQLANYCKLYVMANFKKMIVLKNEQKHRSYVSLLAKKLA